MKFGHWAEKSFKLPASQYEDFYPRLGCHLTLVDVAVAIAVFVLCLLLLVMVVGGAAAAVAVAAAVPTRLKGKIQC